MKTYTLANQKGGCGKSTVAVNLAAGIGAAGCSVLLIDMDPQASATNWYGVQENPKALYDSLVDGEHLRDAVTLTGTNNVDLAPSSDWLVKAARELSGEPGAETILKTRLQELPERWDYVLIDTPPNLEIMTISALTGSDAVLVPVQARYMALEGLARLLRTVNMVQDRLNDSLEIRGIIPNQVDRRNKHSGEVLEKLRDRFDGQVYEPGIRENIRLAEAPSFSEPITKYAPESRGADDFFHLAKQFIRREPTEENHERNHE